MPQKEHLNAVVSLLFRENLNDYVIVYFCGLMDNAHSVIHVVCIVGSVHGVLEICRASVASVKELSVRRGFTLIIFFRSEQEVRRGEVFCCLKILVNLSDSP